MQIFDIKARDSGPYVVYRDGVEYSRHTTERKAISNAQIAIWELPDSVVFYRHEYEVDVRVVGSVAEQGVGDTTAPTIPTGLTATAINKNQIDLLWQASTDAVGVTGYQVFRDGSPLDTVVSSTVSYSDTSVAPSTLYSYTVAAFDAAGNTSAESGADTATTPANAAPTWTPIPDQDLIVGNSFNLDFEDYADDVDVEALTYSIVSGTLPTGVTLSGSILSGTPTTSGETSSITVRADDGNDTADDTFDYTTYDADVTAPPVPTGLAATSTIANIVDLSWNASTDVAGSANEFVSGTSAYRVYRDTALITTESGLTYQDTGLSGGASHDYTISAVDVEGNESAQSSAVNVTVSVNQFAAPGGSDDIYNEFVTNAINMLQSSANNLATGPTDYATNNAYNLTGGASHSVFYGPYDSLRRGEDWAALNGYSHTSLTAGMNRALAAYTTRYGRTASNYGASVIANDAHVPYWGFIEGHGGSDITMTSQDVTNETLKFNFESLNKFKMNTADNPNDALYGFYTARSRPIAHKARAFIYHEKAGFGQYIDPIQSGVYMLSWMEDAMVTHCYRWRNEFQNLGSNVPDPGDATGPFMIGKTLGIMALLYDHRVSQAEDPNLHFPSQVTTGDLNVGSGVSRIANPYTDYLDVMTDVALWLGRPIEGNLTLDTTAYTGLGHAAEYCRVVAANSGRLVGNPMGEVGTGTHGDFMKFVYRNANGESYSAPNIQMVLVYPYYWLARKWDGVNNTTRDRLIAMGNATLYGASDVMPSITLQKVKNETLETVFQGLEEYSAMAGVQY